MNHIISTRSPEQYNKDIAELRTHTERALLGATKAFAERYGAYPKAVFRRVQNRRFRAPVVKGE